MPAHLSCPTTNHPFPRPCPAVWLINYKHFLSWKTLPGSWLPDLSTVEFSVAKATFYFKVGVGRGKLAGACAG